MNMKVFNKTFNGLMKNKMVLYGLVAAVVALLLIGGLVLMKKRKMHEGFQFDTTTYPDTPENEITTTTTPTDTSMESNTTDPSMESNTTEPSVETTTINPESPTIEQCSQMGCYGTK